MNIQNINETNEIKCPHCDNEGVLKYGKYKGVQRYWCKVCKRKFKADDTLFHGKTPANIVTSALNMYYEGMSIKAIQRQIQQETGNTPSTATIYEWVMKYTQYATDSIKDYKPKVGDTWIADETVLHVDGQNLWFWDIIDEKTRYLLASRLSRSRTTRDAQILMDRAIKMAGKSPKTVITDALASYLDVDYGKDAEHVTGGIYRTENNSNLIERFHGTLKQRTKVMRGLHNIDTAHEFTEGWLVHYNFIRPHTTLDDKTPAEAAGIDYPYKSWSDIIRKHKPKGKVIVEHQPRERLAYLKETIDRPKKPGRKPNIRITKPTPRLTPKTPKLSPRMPKLRGNELYIGGGMVSRHYFKGAKRRRLE